MDLFLQVSGAQVPASCLGVQQGRFPSAALGYSRAASRQPALQCTAWIQPGTHGHAAAAHAAGLRQSAAHARGGPGTDPRVPRVLGGWQIAGALVYIHGHKVMHRDLKTANIFLSKGGTVMLGDFGISKVMAVLSCLGNHPALHPTPGCPARTMCSSSMVTVTPPPQPRNTHLPRCHQSVSMPLPVPSCAVLRARHGGTRPPGERAGRQGQPPRPGRLRPCLPGPLDPPRRLHQPASAGNPATTSPPCRCSTGRTAVPAP